MRVRGCLAERMVPWMPGQYFFQPAVFMKYDNSYWGYVLNKIVNMSWGQQIRIQAKHQLLALK